MLSREDFQTTLESLFRFHTKRAPGLALGLAMVDLARERLGPVKDRMIAISETQACLVDVIQMTTGCTIGNRYLRIIPHLGRFALTLYDRHDGRGIRVSVDLSKIDAQKTPEMDAFIHRTRDAAVQAGGAAREASGRKIMDEFERIGRDAFLVEQVWVIDHAKPAMPPAETCRQCGESFLVEQPGEQRCGACQGTAVYYRKTPV